MCKGFPYKMNQEKIKGSSFNKRKKERKKERKEWKKERKKERKKEKRKKERKISKNVFCQRQRQLVNGNYCAS